jgi:hypothetical protein
MRGEKAMSGPTGDTAFSASEKPGRREGILTLGVARRMLPLVRRVVNDLLHARANLTRLQPEQDRLHRQRRDLAWPERARRYQLREEIASHERELQQATAELTALGVALLDPAGGRVGFPTLVNDRRAFFSWKPGEEGLTHWQYAGESTLRLIPASWNEQQEGKLTRKR